MCLVMDMLKVHGWSMVMLAVCCFALSLKLVVMLRPVEYGCYDWIEGGTFRLL